MLPLNVPYLVCCGIGWYNVVVSKHLPKFQSFLKQAKYGGEEPMLIA